MTLDELIAEGEALMRPCLHLAPDEDGPIAGYWGGERADQPNALPETATALASREHIFSLDVEILPRLDTELVIREPTAPLSVFLTTYRSGEERLTVHQDRALNFAGVACSGRPLHAVPARSFPPFEAICLFGSEAVAAWLRSHCFERHHYTQAHHDCLGDEYDHVFRERGSFYAGGVDIVLGGWQTTWPSDDFFMPREMRILATTLRDQYYELWLTPSCNLFVREQIP